MNELKDKNILLYAPIFFDLHSQLIEQLRKDGANVVFVEDTPSFLNTKYIKSNLRFLKSLLYFFLQPDLRHADKTLHEIDKYVFDIVLCVNGFSLHSKMLDAIKRKNPKVFTVLYMWDTVKYYNFKPSFVNFDSIYTFDVDDAKALSINYQPLFWVQEEKSQKTDLKYDLSFIGTLHTNRYTFLKELDSILNNTSIKYLLKLVVNQKNMNFKTIKYFFYKITKRNPGFIVQYKFCRNELNDHILTSVPFSRSEFDTIMLESNCIFDMEIPGQSGQTNRLITALSKNKKILTTNTAIVNSTLYDSRQIMIFDRNKTNEMYSFIKEKLPSAFVNIVIQELRIDKWLSKILVNSRIG